MANLSRQQVQALESELERLGLGKCDANPGGVEVFPSGDHFGYCRFADKWFQGEYHADTVFKILQKLEKKDTFWNDIKAAELGND